MKDAANTTQQCMKTMFLDDHSHVYMALSHDKFYHKTTSRRLSQLDPLAQVPGGRSRATEEGAGGECCRGQAEA